MIHQVDINWIDGLAFNAHADDHSIVIDAPFEAGGQNRGIRPKMLVLASLGGCTGVDIILILKKMKVNLKDLKISVEGKLTDNHPKIYETITLKYIFKGYGLDLSKLEKAIQLSQEKYCGVTAMLEKSVKIDYKIVIEELLEP
ncbi:MAG: OsmC family protein [Chloroflexota bacterium]|jgi:putative redox protein|nr:OsmC family protein [Lentimicrobium sp.]